MEKLMWVKEIFGSRLEILLGNEKVGSIRWQHMFSGRASADFNGKSFLLRRELFSSKLEIYESKGHTLLACVSVNLFNPRTDVIINGKRFELEIKNFWQSRWSWNFNGAEVLVFTSNEFITREKGDIELFSTCKDEVEVLILLGLFVRNQFVLFMVFLLILLILIIL